MPEPIPVVTGEEAGIQTGQVMNPSQGTHTSDTDAQGKCKGSSQPEVCDVHGFGLYEETQKQTIK